MTLSLDLLTPCFPLQPFARSGWRGTCSSVRSRLPFCALASVRKARLGRWTLVLCAFLHKMLVSQLASLSRLPFSVCRLREQTKQQLREYKAMLDAREEKTPEIMQEHQIEEKIEELENEIEEVKLGLETQNLAISRIQCANALKRSLEKTDPKNSGFMDDMKHVIKLQKLIITSQKESRSLEEKLLDIRKKRLELKQTSESKLLEIQTEKNKKKEDLEQVENSEKIQMLRQNLQTELHITTVIQHVFQNLILGSKANWAEDPTLKEIVLQLENNPNMI
ncbi:centromere protein H isoform X1 [Ochotona curzoniae]|uniref:centromere protein H isoform X1 n=1 Tax=Ochotona curzoniae TaxID=130825 RepID=UPI001B348D5A|nr:centromere protein H isoform X1 [Ochotona curzoniae]